MNDSQLDQKDASLLQRFIAMKWLLLALWFQACGWLLMWAYVPNVENRAGYGWSNENWTVYYLDVSSYHSFPVDSKFVRCDLASRSWQIVTRRHALVEFPDAPKGDAMWELKSPSPMSRVYSAELFDKRSRKTLERREFRLPEECAGTSDKPRLHGNRLVVCRSADAIYYLDLTKPDATFQSLQSNRPQVLFNNISGSISNSLYVVEGTQTVRFPFTAFVAIYRLTEDGQLALVDNWYSPDLYCHWSWQDKIITLRTNDRSFKVISSDSGEIVDTIDFPADLTGTPGSYEVVSTQFGLFVNYQTPSGKKLFDFFNRREVTQPPQALTMYGSSPDHSRYVFKTPSGLTVWDAVQNQAITHIPQTSTHISFLDHDRLLQVTSRWGISFDYYDTTSGRLVQSYQPFAWSYALSAFLILALPIWWWRWVKQSSRLGLPVAVDTTLAFLVPLAIGILMADHRRHQTLWNIPTQFTLGVSMAALAMAAFWALSGRGRSPRYSICWLLIEVLNLAGMIWWVRKTNADPTLISWHQHMPLVILALGLQLLRMFSLGVNRANEKNIEASGQRVQLVDFFKLTACAALLVGAVQASFGEPGMNSIELIVDSIWFTALGSIMLFLIVGTLARSPLWFSFVCLVAIAAALGLVADAAARWIWDLQLDGYVRSPDKLRLSILAGLLLCLGCWPLRVRGYRFGKCLV